MSRSSRRRRWPCIEVLRSDSPIGRCRSAAARRRMAICDHDQRHRPDAAVHHRADPRRSLADRAFHSIDVRSRSEHPMTTAAWEAFVVNWLFWSGIAIGAVVFSGLLVLTGAEWAGEI